MDKTEKNKSLTALITGASGGIGYEITQLFARDHVNLILVARSTDKLESIKKDFETLYNIRVDVLSLDLSEQQAYLEILSYIEKENIVIDFLVNNAGFGYQDAFLDKGVEDYREMIQVNIMSLTALTHAIAIQMSSRQSGRILNIASVASFQPNPYFAVYGATKAYVLSFTEALHKEFSHSGVTVTALSPGLTKTGFISRAGIYSYNILSLITLDAKKVAKAGYRAMMRGRRNVIPGFGYKFVVFLSAIVPTSRFKLWVIAKIMKPYKHGN